MSQQKKPVNKALGLVAQPLFRARRQRDRKNDYSRKGKSKWRHDG